MEEALGIKHLQMSRSKVEGNKTETITASPEFFGVLMWVNLISECDPTVVKSREKTLVLCLCCKHCCSATDCGVLDQEKTFLPSDALHSVAKLK